jgi:hypothetical protein
LVTLWLGSKLSFLRVRMHTGSRTRLTS